MNIGFMKDVRQWIFTFVLAVVLATAATTVALNIADSDDTAAHHMWYTGHQDGDGNGGG